MGVKHFSGIIFVSLGPSWTSFSNFFVRSRFLFKLSSRIIQSLHSFLKGILPIQQEKIKTSTQASSKLEILTTTQTNREVLE